MGPSFENLLRGALRTIDEHGFGADVDADSIIEKAAREHLEDILNDAPEGG